MRKFLCLTYIKANRGVLLLVQSEELQSPPSTVHGRNCRFRPKSNSKSKKKRQKQNSSNLSKRIIFSGVRTFTRSDSEQTLDDFPINEAVVDGEDVDLFGLSRRELKPVDLLRPPSPRTGAVPRHEKFFFNFFFSSASLSLSFLFLSLTFLSGKFFYLKWRANKRRGREEGEGAFPQQLWSVILYAVMCTCFVCLSVSLFLSLNNTCLYRKSNLSLSKKSQIYFFLILSHNAEILKSTLVRSSKSKEGQLPLYISDISRDTKLAISWSISGSVPASERKRVNGGGS